MHCIYEQPQAKLRRDTQIDLRVLKCCDGTFSVYLLNMRA